MSSDLSVSIPRHQLMQSHLSADQIQELKILEASVVELEEAQEDSPISDQAFCLAVAKIEAMPILKKLEQLPRLHNEEFPEGYNTLQIRKKIKKFQEVAGEIHQKALAQSFHQLQESKENNLDTLRKDRRNKQAQLRESIRIEFLNPAAEFSKSLFSQDYLLNVDFEDLKVLEASVVELEEAQEDSPLSDLELSASVRKMKNMPILKIVESLPNLLNEECPSGDTTHEIIQKVHQFEKQVQNNFDRDVARFEDLIGKAEKTNDLEELQELILEIQELNLVARMKDFSGTKQLVPTIQGLEKRVFSKMERILDRPAPAPSPAKPFSYKPVRPVQNRTLPPSSNPIRVKHSIRDSVVVSPSSSPEEEKTTVSSIWDYFSTPSTKKTSSISSSRRVQKSAASEFGVGFHNKGNNCWANVLLQAIVHIDTLRAVYNTIVIHYSASAISGARRNAKRLGAALEAYDNALLLREPVPPEVSQNVRIAFHFFSGKQISKSHRVQEDAHEGFTLLMALYAGIIEEQGGDLTANCPLYFTDVTTRSWIRKGPREQARSYTSDIIKTGEKTGKTQLNNPPTYEIGLSMTSSSNKRPSFNDLLEDIFCDKNQTARATYAYPGTNDAYEFKMIKEERTFKQQPMELVVTMKRFSYNERRERTQKITTKIQVPFELQLPGVNEPLELDFFFSHKGPSASAGHYICFYKDIAGRWIKFDDESPSLPSVEEVTQALQESYWHHYKRKTEQGARPNQFFLDSEENSSSEPEPQGSKPNNTTTTTHIPAHPQDAAKILDATQPDWSTLLRESTAQLKESARPFLNNEQTPKEVKKAVQIRFMRLLSLIGGDPEESEKKRLTELSDQLIAVIMSMVPTDDNTFQTFDAEIEALGKSINSRRA